jgi:hypothetical protein
MHGDRSDKKDEQRPEELSAAALEPQLRPEVIARKGSPTNVGNLTNSVG